MPSGSGYCRSTWACLADSLRSASHTPDRTASHRTRGTGKDPAFFRCLPYCSPVRKNARGLGNKGLLGMKKAVADLAPTLPVNEIYFRTNPHSTRIFHAKCTFPGPVRRPSDPGVSISRKSTQEGAPVTCASSFQDYDLPRLHAFSIDTSDCCPLFRSFYRGTSYTAPASSTCPRRASGLLGAE